MKDSVQNIIQSWGFSDPESSFNWLSKQSPAIYNQESVHTFFQYTAYSHPEFVDQRLDMLESRQERTNIARQVYQSIKRKSIERAEAYLEQSPYKEGIKQLEVRLESYKE